MIFLFGCPVAGQANRKTCPVSGQANCIFDIHMSCSRTTVSQTKVFHLSCSRTHILYIAIYPGIKADMYKRVSVQWIPVIPLPQGAWKGGRYYRYPYRWRYAGKTFINEPNFRRVITYGFLSIDPIIADNYRRMHLAESCCQICEDMQKNSPNSKLKRLISLRNPHIRLKEEMKRTQIVYS